LGALIAVHYRIQPRLPLHTVTSSDASVLELHPIPSPRNVAFVWARASGAARLSFSDERGDLVGEAELVVAPAEEIDVRPPHPATEPLLVMAGGRLDLGVVTLDRRGRRLFGVGAVRYDAQGGLSVESELQRTERAIARAEHYFMVPDSLRVHADDALGVATLNLESGDATRTVSLEIVDQARVHSLRLVDPFSGSLLGASGRCLEAIARSDEDHVVFSPACTWTIDEHDEQRVISMIDRDRICFERRDSDHDTIAFNVRCRVGGVESLGWIELPPP
jgi:hypothetical protein